MIGVSWYVYLGLLSLAIYKILWLIYAVPDYNLSWVWGGDRKNLPEGHCLASRGFDFNVAVATNESRSYMLASAILKVEDVYDIVMMSTPNILTTELQDLLYSQCVVIHFLSIPRV